MGYGLQGTLQSMTATSTKTSFIIASFSVFLDYSSLLIFDKLYPNYPGTELGGTVLKLREKIKHWLLCPRVFLRT